MKKIFLSLCCVSILISCKKEVVEGPQGPQGIPGTNATAGTGTISGSVRQYDTYSNLVLTNLNTTTVSIDGSTLSAVTDASGNYSLTNVPNGVFDLSFNKTGAGLKKINQVVFPGSGKLVLNTSLFDKPDYVFNSGYIKDTISFSSPSYLVNLKMNPINKSRFALIIFGKTSAVDLANPASYEWENAISLSPNSVGYYGAFSMEHQGFNNFVSGSTIYVKVYPVSNPNSTYYDYINDKEVYTNYGTPLAGTFTLTKS